jgi:hypothetical protein
MSYLPIRCSAVMTAQQLRGRRSRFADSPDTLAAEGAPRYPRSNYRQSGFAWVSSVPPYPYC